MPDSEDLQPHLTTLEDTLVHEFRACQSLVALTQNERQALFSNNVPALQDLLAEKEALLGNLDRLEKARQTAMDHWRHQTGFEAQTLAEMLPSLDPAKRERLKRLREGILALTTQLRELSQGNRALANSALDGLEAVRHFLLTLSQTPVGYQRPGASSDRVPTMALAIEQLA